MSRVEGRGFHVEGEGTMSRVEGNIFFEDIFPGISIQAFSVIYFSVVSDVNLLLLKSCKKLDSVFQVCLLRNLSLNIHIVYTLFFLF